MNDDNVHLIQANIVGGVFYLLFIQIMRDVRGQGHGDRLYKCCEEIAQRLGCTEIRQTPSGGYFRSRMDYLIDRGWKIVDKDANGIELFKHISSE
jgi:GNAT superfamily N-acetyltransferase